MAWSGAVPRPRRVEPTPPWERLGISERAYYAMPEHERWSALELASQSQGIHRTGDEALPFVYGPLLGNLTTAGIRTLPKAVQTARNIRNPNVTARGFVRNPATGKEGVFAHGTTRRNVKFSELDPAAKHVTDSGYLSEGLYGGIVNPAKGIRHNFNMYSIRSSPNLPGMHVPKGTGKGSFTPMDEGFYPGVYGRPFWGTPTTHVYRLKGKPYVHGKMPVNEMKKINSTISKLREANPRLSRARIKTMALRKHGYEVEIFDPKAMTKMDEFGKIVPKRPVGPYYRHPEAEGMVPRSAIPEAEAVALTPEAIAPRWNPPRRSLPFRKLVLPAIQGRE
tara:strand:- start:1323 stop:2330 length:1008 start_codon:yes stop_codon:yes gene_type:complete